MATSESAPGKQPDNNPPNDRVVRAARGLTDQQLFGMPSKEVENAKVPDEAPTDKPDEEVLEEVGEEAGPKRPKNSKSTEDISDEYADEQDKPLRERIIKKQKKLAYLREEMARVGSQRGTRLFGKKNRERPLEVIQGEYQKTLRKLAKLKLKSDIELKELWNNKDLSDDDKKRLETLAFQKGMQFMDVEQTRLRNRTNERMKKGLVGKLANFMSNGGVARHLIVMGAGVAAGVTVTLATGGVAGGVAVGLGANTFIRGFRSLAMGEKKRGRTLDEHEHEITYEQLKELPVSLKKMLKEGTYTLGAGYNQAVEKRRKNFKSSLRWAIGMTAAGGAVGTAHQFGLFDRLPGFGGGNSGDAPQGSGSGTTDQSPSGANDDPSLKDVLDNHNGEIDGLDVGDFEYKSGENPFYLNKESTHGMGPRLHADTALDNGRPGLNDLTQNRWVNSPHQLSSIVHAMHLDNLPDDMQSANSLAETFKIKPDLMQDMHSRVLDIINDPSTHIETGVPIENAYESEWGIDPQFENTGQVTPGSDFELAWDDYVNHAEGNGTKTIITFKNPNPPHAMETIELREDCGGQRIKELPPPPAPVQQYQPTYRAPVHEYSPPPASYTPPSGPPPPNLPPPPPPPPELPPPPPPPELPPPPPPPPPMPDKPRDNPLDSVIPDIFKPRPVGPGPVNIPHSSPPNVYTPPSSGGNGGGLAPDAAPSRPTPNVKPASPGLNPRSGRNSGLV